MRTGKGFVHRLVIGAPVFIWITAGVLGIPSASLAAFSTLHKFITSGSDGTFPHGAVTISGSTLYGTTSEGGGATPSAGTVFKIEAGGTGYKILHSFNVSDGGAPRGSLTLSWATLYGTTSEGGDQNDGTVFKINTNGSGFKVLHSFNGGDGASPHGSLTLLGSTLYGMTAAQGPAGSLGTIFKINTDGSGFTVLHSFSSVNGGGGPFGSLTPSSSGTTLYGMTAVNGVHYDGTIFRINTDGSGYQVLHSFQGGANDGSSPYGDLTLSGSTLYGMTSLGGAGGYGTIFKISTSGSGFKVLHSFKWSDNGGITPCGSLSLSGSKLYGMTSGGGVNYGYGTIFQMNTDGSGYQVLHTFSGGDGGAAQGSLALAGSALYGMTMQYGGGASAAGTIFSMTGSFITVPGAPRNVTAKAGAAQATVTFTPPASNGGSPITGYTVRSNPAGGVDANAGTTSTTHTVKKLTKGTAYTFTATAKNKIGTGPPSKPSTKIIPTTSLP